VEEDGKFNPNQIIGTREYKVEFYDQTVLEYTANVIAENLYARVDAEGRRYVLLDAIIDQTRDQSAILQDDEFV
jgi:hypothetical protein